MNTSVKTGIIGCLAGAAIVAIAFFAYTKISGGGATDAGSSNNGAENQDPPTPVPMKTIEKKPIKASAVDRVVSRTMKGEFGLTGRGENADWGLAQTANFKYTIMVVADSKIVSKETLPGGEIKITEIRTFNKVQDSVVVSDVDLKLALDTLPVKEFSAAIDVAVSAWVGLTGDVAGGALVLEGKNYVANELKKVNGTSYRALLGAIGLRPTQEVENMINQLTGAQILKALGGIRSISGKSYKITYYQQKSGTPLYVKFTYPNGEPVTDEDEKMVLKRVNAFIDYNLVPNQDCAPGDSWKIQAGDMQEVFDPYVEGTYTGTIAATRKSNNDAGDWVVQLSPSMINIVNDSGNTTGHFNLSRGYAYVNPDIVSVKELFVEGKAQLEKLSRHHWLFKARISGECDFQGKMVTTHKK